MRASFANCCEIVVIKGPSGLQKAAVAPARGKRGLTQVDTVFLIQLALSSPANVLLAFIAHK